MAIISFPGILKYHSPPSPTLQPFFYSTQSQLCVENIYTIPRRGRVVTREYIHYIRGFFGTREYLYYTRGFFGTREYIHYTCRDQDSEQSHYLTISTCQDSKSAAGVLVDWAVLHFYTGISVMSFRRLWHITECVIALKITCSKQKLGVDWDVL